MPQLQGLLSLCSSAGWSFRIFFVALAAATKQLAAGNASCNFCLDPMEGSISRSKSSFQVNAWWFFEQVLVLFPLLPFMKWTLEGFSMILTLHWQTFTDFALFLLRWKSIWVVCVLGKQAVPAFFSWHFIRRTFQGSQGAVMWVLNVMLSLQV